MEILITFSTDRWKEYREIRLRSLQEEPLAYTKSYEEEATMTDEEWQTRLKTSVFVFAESKNKLIGMMTGYRNMLKKNNHIYHIVSVFVDKEYRGKGIGKKLLLAIIEKIKSLPEIKKIELSATTTQTAAIGLYKSVGFKEIGISHMFMKHEDKYYDEVIMEMILP